MELPGSPRPWRVVCEKIIVQMAGYFGRMIPLPLCGDRSGARSSALPGGHTPPTRPLRPPHPSPHTPQTDRHTRTHAPPCPLRAGPWLLPTAHPQLLSAAVTQASPPPPGHRHPPPYPVSGALPPAHTLTQLGSPMTSPFSANFVEPHGLQRFLPEGDEFHVATGAAGAGWGVEGGGEDSRQGAQPACVGPPLSLLNLAIGPARPHSPQDPPSQLSCSGDT